MLEAVSAAARDPWLMIPAQWPTQTDLLLWCEQMSAGLAMLLIVAGIIYLLFGWHMFRVLVALNAVLLGAAMGVLIGGQWNAALIGAILGGFCFGALAWPFIKYAVAVMGGLFGLIIGGSIWQMSGLDPVYAWAGGMMGLILLGLLTFILFRGSVMMFTSLQGAVMLILGILGMTSKYPQIAAAMAEGLSGQPLLLPMAIFISGLTGLIYQQTHSAAPEGEARGAAA
jgi:hypothetical protein